MAVIYDPSIVLLLLLPILRAIYLAKKSPQDEQQHRCQEVDEHNLFETPLITHDPMSPSSSSSSSTTASPRPYQPIRTGALWRLTSGCSSFEPLSPIDLPEAIDLKPTDTYVAGHSHVVSATYTRSKTHLPKDAKTIGSSGDGESMQEVQGYEYDWAARRASFGPRGRKLRVMNPDLPTKTRRAWLGGGRQRCLEGDLNAFWNVRARVSELEQMILKASKGTVTGS